MLTFLSGGMIGVIGKGEYLCGKRCYHKTNMTENIVNRELTCYCKRGNNGVVLWLGGIQLLNVFHHQHVFVGGDSPYPPGLLLVVTPSSCHPTPRLLRFHAYHITKREEDSDKKLQGHLHDDTTICFFGSGNNNNAELDHGL